MVLRKKSLRLSSVCPQGRASFQSVSVLTPLCTRRMLSGPHAPPLHWQNLPLWCDLRSRNVTNLCVEPNRNPCVTSSGLCVCCPIPSPDQEQEQSSCGKGVRGHALGFRRSEQSQTTPTKHAPKRGTPRDSKPQATPKTPPGLEGKDHGTGVAGEGTRDLDM